MSRLRTLHVDPELGFGGGETQVLELLCHLARRGHASWVATPSEGILAARLRELDVASPVPLVCRTSHDPRAGLRLRGWLRRHPVDLVHLHTARALSLAPYLPRRVLRVLTRRMDYPPRGVRWYVDWLYGQVDAVIAISSAARDALVARGVPADRIEVVASGVDVARFAALDRAAARRELGLAPALPVLAIVASLHRRKGHAVLLKALQALAEGARRRGAAPPFLLVAGEGPEESALRDLAAVLGVASQVRWLGRTADVRPVLAAADVVVAPSHAEGLGVAVIESLAAGRTVVASAVGGLRELVRDEVDGLLVPPGDVTALSNALARVLGDEALRMRLSAAAPERAAQFSTAAMARGTEAVYERALAARARRSAGS